MKKYPKVVSPAVERPSESEALDAVRTLIAYLGDNPNRPGLLETPQRVLRSYAELFSGYGCAPGDLLGKTFDEVDGYRDLVLVRDINVDSHCEHHLLPIRGMAHVAYLPSKQVVGLSKLARLVDSLSRRLQTQERLTAQIAETLQNTLHPRGVAVVIEADHACMSLRGIQARQSLTVTQHFTGELDSDLHLKERYLEMLRQKR